MPELQSQSWHGELGFFDPWSRIREYRPGFLILRMIKIEEMEKNSISKLLLEKKNVFFYVGSGSVFFSQVRAGSVKNQPGSATLIYREKTKLYKYADVKFFLKYN